MVEYLYEQKKGSLMKNKYAWIYLKKALIIAMFFSNEKVLRNRICLHCNFPYVFVEFHFIL